MSVGPLGLDFCEHPFSGLTVRILENTSMHASLTSFVLRRVPGEENMPVPIIVIEIPDERPSTESWRACANKFIRDTWV